MIQMIVMNSKIDSAWMLYFTPATKIFENPTTKK